MNLNKSELNSESSTAYVSKPTIQAPDSRHKDTDVVLTPASPTDTPLEGDGDSPQPTSKSKKRRPASDKKTAKQKKSRPNAFVSLPIRTTKVSFKVTVDYVVIILMKLLMIIYLSKSLLYGLTR